MEFPIIKISDTSELTGRDFVGVSQNDKHQLQVTVPYGVEIPSIVDNTDVKNMRFLKTYVKAIQKALNDKSVKNSIEEVTSGVNHPLAAVNIIYDYLTMGALVEFETNEVRTNSGKMDINRTIQKIIPSYVNGNLFYDEYITRKRVVLQENYSTIVQGNIINHFMKNGGEILFGSSIKVPVKPLKLDKTCIQKLRREMNKTFNSRKLMVIHWMIEYMSGILISKDAKGTWNYAIIASTLWEVMVDSVFGNQVKKNKTLYGKRYSFYSLIDDKNSSTGSPTQHDTIYETETEIIIIDAKMYGRDSSLLTEEVLGKQFGYYIEAKRKHPEKKVINVLFIPINNELSEVNPGFSNQIIMDPHSKVTDDPDKMIFLYHYPTNELITDYYFSKRKLGKISDDFHEFVNQPMVRKFLNSRGSSY